MKYQEPIATIVDSSRRGDVTVTTLRVSELLSPPLVPGGLYSREDPGQERMQLHKIIGQAGKKLTFESYGIQSKLPLKGDTFIFRVWWTPDQLDVASDTELVWVREKYPDNGDHEHCYLTWEAISAYADPREGYRAGKIWITVDAYNRFIRDDVLRLRHRPKQEKDS